nr:glycoside hydrolase family 65 protein [Chloroflexota bacterium]
MNDLWILSEDSFEPAKQHHKETIFTIGNGYLSTRGAFEEGYLDDHRATFVHGVFDDVPIGFTELANAPDWLPLYVLLNGERFSLSSGRVESYERHLDLRSGVLTRTIRWHSPSGHAATLIFERFASLEDEHLLCLRCTVTTDFDGTIEIRAALNCNTDNEGLAHWQCVEQGAFPSLKGDLREVTYLRAHTRATDIELAQAMRLVTSETPSRSSFWDTQSIPTLSLTFSARRGQAITVDKFVGIATSRDTTDPVSMAVEHVKSPQSWESALEAHQQAWGREWERCDIEIEGDDEAQIAIRFNLFQLLIAAPRHDTQVN